MSKEIRGNQMHLTLENRIYIEKGLDNGMAFKETIKYLCKDPVQGCGRFLGQPKRLYQGFVGTPVGSYLKWYLDPLFVVPDQVVVKNLDNA